MPDAKETTHQDPSKIPNPISKQPDLTGCTFEGKQLSAAELEEQERLSEFMELHRQEIQGKLVILRRKHQGAKGSLAETKRVARRAKRFTANEIRKEYGIMKKPYKTKIENILWCICNKGPIDMNGMGEELGLPPGKETSKALSGPISNMFNLLGTEKPYAIGWVDREREDGRYYYSLRSDGFDGDPHGGVNKSPEVIYQKYLSVQRDLFAAKNPRPSKISAAQPNKKDSDRENIPPADEVTIDLESIQEVIKNTVEKAARRILGVHVTVSGKVEILFGFIRRG
jgi:hypothetical protein